MNKISCPKCCSTFVQKQTSYAAVKHEGCPVQKTHIVPNECREENCRYKWYD